MTLKEIAEFLSLEFSGDNNKVINQVGSIEDASENELCFLRNSKYKKYLSQNFKGVVILKRADDQDDYSFDKIYSEDPEIDWLKVVNEIFKKSEKKNYISKLAAIAESASISNSAYIDDFVVIKDNVYIGERVILHPGVVLYDNVSIGDDTEIYPHVVVYHGSKIGKRTIIHANSVIGSDGFGYVLRNKVNIKVPQIGAVIIGNDVEIGACTTIDRAAIRQTIIEDGTKIDNLVQIGHNSKLGKNSALSAQVGLAGHSEIGENCLIGGQVGFAGHLKIGNNCIIYAKSGVANSFPDESLVFGSPAKLYSDTIKDYKNIMRISRILDRVIAIEKKIGLEKNND